MGRKAGDNSQVLALAEALGWPFEIKRFTYRSYELVTNLLAGVTLAGTDPVLSSPLSAPWPDLIITAGRRNEPVARWIRREACRDGKDVRIVHLGRPWAHYDQFDLIVTTPQYRLPEHPRVLHNLTPLHRVTSQRLEAAAEEWRGRLDHLPAPYVAVCVGGNSGPYTLDRRSARLLGHGASELARSLGGSLLVSTSARTPPGAAQELEASIDVPYAFYHWRAGDAANPYFAYLGLARHIIVTGDSMSMLTEACATLKPVHIFDLGDGRNSMRAEGNALSQDPGQPWWKVLDRDHLRALVYRAGMRVGPRRLTRDIRIIHRALMDARRAVWLGEAFPGTGESKLPPLNDLERAVAAVSALFTPAGSKAELRLRVCGIPTEELASGLS